MKLLWILAIGHACGSKVLLRCAESSACSSPRLPTVLLAYVSSVEYSSSSAIFAHLNPCQVSAIIQQHSILRGREKGIEGRWCEGEDTSTSLYLSLKNTHHGRFWAVWTGAVRGIDTHRVDDSSLSREQHCVTCQFVRSTSRLFESQEGCVIAMGV